MATNQILTIDQITNEAVRLFTQTNAFLKNVSRQYDDQFARHGAKIGTALRIRLPNDYIVSTGPAITPQGTAEKSTTLTVATQKNVPVAFTSAEKTMKLDDYSSRILAPAINRLAAAVAADLMTVANQSANLVYNADTSGAIINPVAKTWLQAGAMLDKNLAPRMDRKIILDPTTQANTVSSLAGLFNPQVRISDQYETGLITKDTLGFDWMYDQTTQIHTVGTLSAAAVNGANQTGSTLNITGVTGTMTVGDVFTIDGVYAINRLTGASYGTLQQFVATVALPSAGASLSFYPPITPAPAAYNTVTASPASGAVIRLVAPASSTYRQNLAFYPEAFTLATADMVMPTQGVVASARATYDGVTLRMIEGYDIRSDELITRVDILYGYAAIRPEWSCIVADSLT